MRNELSVADLEATFDAFNRHDIDGVMTHFSDDCVFFTVGGDAVHGTRIEGRDAIARAFVAVWTGMPDAQWARHSHFVCGDRAVSEWTFEGTGADGMRIKAEGADIFTLSEGKIVVKQALRKQRPAFRAE